MVDSLVHIKTAEGLLQAAMNQIEIIEPENGVQAGAQEDMKDILNAAQNNELMALRRACE